MTRVWPSVCGSGEPLVWAKLFTFLTHVFFCSLHLAVNIAIMHVSLLLGLWGAQAGEVRAWWVPSPVHEPLAMLLFVVIGVVHYFGVAVIAYKYLERAGCSEDLYQLKAIVDSWPQDSDAATQADGLRARSGCTLGVNGSWVDECTECGCARPCEFAFVGEWARGLPPGTTVRVGLAIALEAAGCIQMEGGIYGEAEGVLVLVMAPWSVLERVWFCFVLLTTVGYGNTFSPGSDASREFTLVWSIYGLFIFGAASGAVWPAVCEVAADLAAAMRRLAKACSASERVAAMHLGDTSVRAVEGRLARGAGMVRGAAVAAAGDAGLTPQKGFTPPDVYYVARDLYVSFICFLILNFAGSAIFLRVEDGWHFVDAFYHCMMTATTIGLGDIAPQTSAGRAYGIVHMVFSVMLLGSIIGTILDAYARRVTASKKDEMLRKKVDVEAIAALDRDGNGVDKAEFVLGMLQLLGVLSEEDYAPFVLQFEHLDKANDGLLSRADLLLAAKANAEASLAAKVRHEAERRKAVGRMRSHALQSVCPAFVASFGFIWPTFFGFSLTVGGLVHGLKITTILGSAPSLFYYRRVAVLAAVGGACFLTTIALILVYLIEPEAYLEHDLSNTVGHLEGGVTTHPTEAERASRLARAEAAAADPWARLHFGLYIFLFVYAVWIDVQTIICCMQAMRDLKETSEDSFRHEDSTRPSRSSPSEAWADERPETAEGKGEGSARPSVRVSSPQPPAAPAPVAYRNAPALPQA